MAPSSSEGGFEEDPAPAPEPILTYRIDLSLPPSERYVKLASDFASRMQEITPLFDEILATIIPWAWLRRVVEWLASLVLFRVYSQEETQELKGISKSSGVSMYFLVALNVLLDSLLGCTSGGILTRPKRRAGVEENPWDEGETTERMMHFRTLDWGMDELRRVLVVVEFVRSKSETPEKVIARTITYAGFVGALTGVREELSLSLNFRPNHNCSTISLRIHQLAVLFGFRPSITSILRSNFFPSVDAAATQPLEKLVNNLTTSRTAPCYLILSSGTSTTVIEKDLLNGTTRSSSDFIVQTNHDVQTTDPAAHTHSQNEKSTVIGMDSLIEESEQRRACVVKKWNSLVRRQEKKRRERGEGNEAGTGRAVVRERTLLWWVKSFPTMNECTHFGCLLDPKSGTIRWLERGVEEDEEDIGEA